MDDCNYRMVHVPLSSREPTTILEGMDKDEAKKALRSRAFLLERKYGALCVVAADGLSMEISDDEALMIGDYQGITALEAE